LPNSDCIVYVIDDDKDVCDGLKALFDSMNMKNEVFSSTKEFLAYKRPDLVSCIVLDVRLPGASGIDFQHELAQFSIHIPVIFISGHGDIPMSVKAMKAGAIGFFTKPVHDQDLLDSIHIAFDKDRLGREHRRLLTGLQEKYNSLSPREKEIMELVTAGLPNKQSAAEVGVSEVTVKVHRHNVMKKLGAKSLPDLVRMADVLDIKPTKTRSG
jgi:FixJ family two-component response regulator